MSKPTTTDNIDIKRTVPPGFAPADFGWPVPFLELIGDLHIKETEAGIVAGTWVTDEKRNGAQMAHGGLLLTLADLATGYAGYRLVEEGQFLVHVSLSMDFYAPAPVGAWVEARVKMESQGKSIFNAACEFFVEEKKIGHARAILKSTRRIGSKPAANG